MTWFKRKKKATEDLPAAAERTVKTEGLFVKCPKCNTTIFKKDLMANWNVCSHCRHHMKLSARYRLEMMFDEGSYELFDENVLSTDPLNFVDTKPYKDRLASTRAATGYNEAVLNAEGKVNGFPVVMSVMVYEFIGGSMGAVVGEKITRAIERAIAKRCPIVITSASGGARMMEGTLSLMQMAKISAALARLDDAKLPFISILTDPTTGGVTASYAMLGDLNIAEPGALIGFAGPRVIEQTIRQKLPPGFQTSEFLLDHGMLDAVVDRVELRNYIIQALEFMMPAAQLKG
ncbi:MAG: acetyl-CoA carboxylase carboxyltransferase subunit beta [Acidobacteria bacterium]|nr:acetyl-CoA carboxylase carboxyltransferase subunit beta [Acidobacteriota bacterium]